MCLGAFCQHLNQSSLSVNRDNLYTKFLCNKSTFRILWNVVEIRRQIGSQVARQREGLENDLLTIIAIESAIEFFYYFRITQQ